jgi:uncharacterized protein YkwD
LKKIVSIFLATIMAASSVVMAFAKPIIKGDTNNDGKITAIDSRNILLVVSGQKTISKSERPFYDVNGSGLVTAVDARMALRIVAGLDEPIIEEITTEELTTKKPVTEEPTKKPTTEESTTKEPTTVETTTQKPEADTASEKERMMSLLETEFVRLLNEERVKNGRGELKVNEILHKAARLRAVECLEKFSHTRPNGKSYKSILQGDLEYTWVHISENIAWFYEAPYPVTNWNEVLTDSDMKTYAKDLFKMFKNSSIHYENILYKNFTETGFGVVIIINKEGTLKVACSNLFGTPA